MQQRQLRLGDILDDYCPRERRITNHAIVAIVGQEVRQTRCVTCEAEHEYKQARIPPQRKKKPAQGALYQEVLSGMPARVAPSPPTAVALDEDDEPAEVADVKTVALPDGDGVQPPQAPEESEGPVHRPLIRATLPRPEGQVPVRPMPDFTVRQPGARPGRFRPNGNHRRGPAEPRGGSGFGASGRRGGPATGGGRPNHGNRTRPAQPDRQGGRRRGGKKRTK